MYSDLSPEHREERRAAKCDIH